MKIGINKCCAPSVHFEVGIINRDVDDKGDNTGIVRIGAVHCGMWLRYCPFCGKEVELRMIKDA